jgi:hypothetical protein
MEPAVWIGIVGAVVAVGCLFVLALCQAAGQSKRPELVMADISTPDALRQLLAKAQREVDILNGVRR